MIVRGVRSSSSFKRIRSVDIPLPTSAQLIADVIGRAATLQLADATKNRKLYVPVTLCGGHTITRCGQTSRITRPRCTCRSYWIANVIGDELAVRLSEHFGGEHLDLATCYYLRVVDRNRRIRSQFADGATRAELIAEYNLSPRTIRYILGGWNGRQDRPREASDARKTSRRPPRRTRPAAATRIDETQSVFFVDGVPRKVDFTIELKQYASPTDLARIAIPTVLGVISRLFK